MTSYVNSTSFATIKQLKKSWWIIDASGIPVGRLASRVTLLLRGKTKSFYTPYMDCGDSVVIVNADKVHVTGDKLNQKKFFWHTGYPGGIKEKKWKDILSGKAPHALLMKAIERMMPKESPLARKQMKSLYVYCGNHHPHSGQSPQEIVVTKKRNNID